MGQSHLTAGTQGTSFYRGQSRGFFKLAEPLVVRLTRKHFQTAADNLRAPGRPRAVTSPFLVADPNRPGAPAGTRSQQAPGHPGKRCAY